jgi:ribosomal protein S18 acetylase RimI-like enzyme
MQHPAMEYTAATVYQEFFVPCRIRRAETSDAGLLAEFAARTFTETFGAANTVHDMAAHLTASYGVRQQRAEVADPHIATLLAEADLRLAAYAQVRRNDAPVDPPPDSAVELWRFYVDRRWHGRGVAQRLMAAVRDVAVEFGARRVWLSVWERNERAIAFYRKAGFRLVGSKDFWVGSDRQTDHVMISDLG